jgi:hypothetical protein
LSTAGVGSIRIGTGGPASVQPTAPSARRGDAYRLAASRGGQNSGDRTRLAGPTRPITVLAQGGDPLGPPPRRLQPIWPPDRTILVGRT